MPLGDMKKQAGHMAGVIGDKAKELGDELGERIKDGAEVVADKAQEGVEALQVAYYNPLMPEDFQADDFDLPKIIIIVDEDQRKGIEVCDGAIGWLSKEAGVETLHLYEEAVPFSGLQFVPIARCESAYYVDQFEKDIYVDLACYFDVMQKDKRTELREIAYMLGAKRCRLEQRVGTKSAAQAKGKVGVKAKAGKKDIAGADVEGEGEKSQSSEWREAYSETFEGNAEPQIPDLKWYAGDKEIRSLIKKRFANANTNTSKTYHVEINSATSSTMSGSMAAKLDKAMKTMGVKLNISLAGKSHEELNSSFVFDVEF